MRHGCLLEADGAQRTISSGPAYAPASAGERGAPKAASKNSSSGGRREFDPAIRRMAGSNFRRPPEELFFDGAFCKPLPPAEAGAYAEPLELVRLAPSASNRQPWRIVRTPTGWHFFLARTKGYGKGTLLFTVLRLADLQRVDMGIAMCHFELAACEAGLAGSWESENPGIATPRIGLEYTATWRPAR